MDNKSLSLFLKRFHFQVLVYLQLYKNISVVFLDSWQEVTDHVCAVTKALSKRPFKYATVLCPDIDSIAADCELMKPPLCALADS